MDRAAPQTELLRLAVDVADAIHGVEDLKTLAEKTVAALSRITGSPRIAFYLYRPEEQQLQVIWARGFDRAVCDVSAVLPVEGSFSGYVMRSGQVQGCADLEKCRQMSSHTKRALLQAGFRSIVVVPVLYRDEPLGVIDLVFRDSRPLQESDRVFYFSISRIVGMALKHVQHVQRLREEIQLRTRREKELENYREMLEEAEELAAFGSWVYDFSTGEIRRSRELFQILGVPPEKAPASLEDFWPYIHEADRERVRAEFQEGIRSRGESRLRFRIVRPDKRVRCIAVRMRVQRDKEGNPRCMYGSFQDVTELVEAQESVRRYSQQLETLRNIDRLIISGKSLAEIGHASLKGLAKLIPLHRGSIVRFLWEENQVEVLAAYRQPVAGLQNGSILPIDHFPVPKSLYSGKIQIVDDLSTREQRSPVEQQLLDSGIRSYIKVPILVGSNLLGTLHIAPVNWQDVKKEDLEFLQEVGNVLGMAIRQQQLMEENRRSAEELERKVEEKTAHLRKILRAMAGREVRMAELKDVIRQLRRQLLDAGLTPVADDPLTTEE